MRELIDGEDAILIARGAVLYALGAGVVLVSAVVLGIAVRVFALVGGIS